MRGYFTYIIKTWAATMVATPIVYVPLLFLFGPSKTSEYPFYAWLFVLIFIGLIFSIPSLLLLSVASIYLEKVINDTRTLKIVAVLISSALVILSFIFFFNDADERELPAIIGLAITYIAAIFIFGFWFKINPSKHHSSSF